MIPQASLPRPSSLVSRAPLAQSADAFAHSTAPRNDTSESTPHLLPAVTPDDYRCTLPTIARALTPVLGFGGGVGATLWAASTFVPILGMGLNFVGGFLFGAAALGSLLAIRDAPEEVIRTVADCGGLLAGCAFVAAGPLVPAILVGGGLIAGMAHFALEKEADGQQLEADKNAHSGHYRTAPLFRDAVNRKEDATAYAAEVEAVEALERNGWTVQGTRSTYEGYEIGRGTRIGLHDPNGCRRDGLPIRLVPLLSGLLGHTPLPEAPELQTACRLGPLVERGVSLGSFYIEGPATVDDRVSGTVSLVGAIDALRNGDRVGACSGRVVIPLDSLDFNDAATRLERLAPLFEACQQTPALAEALERSSSRARQSLGATLTGVSSAEMQAHLKALATLAAAGAPAEGRGGLLQDYRTLLASRDVAVPLEQSAAEYATLLSALARVGHAQVAHEAYTALRASVISDGSGEGFDVKVERFMTVLAAGGSLDAAREAALRPSSTVQGTVEKGDDIVRIGGVAVPVRKPPV